MIAKLLAFLTIAFSTATQLRITGLPIGVSEACGFLFIIGQLRRLDSYVPLIRPFGLLIVGFSLSFLVGSQFNVWSGAPTAIDLQSYVALMYSIVFVIAFAEIARSGTDIAALVTAACVFATGIHIVPYFLELAGVSSGFQIWISGADFGDEILDEDRYTGLSTNPNQLGVLLVGTPALLFWRLRLAQKWPGRLVLGLALVASLALIMLTKSDTLQSIVFFCLAYAIFSMLGLIVDPRNKQIVKGLKIIGSLIVGAAFLYVFLEFIESGLNKSGERTANGRFTLWKFAIKAFLRSYGLGYGPGPHVVSPEKLGGEEAHNVLLDLALQGGILAVLTYVAFCWIIYKVSAKYAAPSLRILFFCVLIHQMSHYTLRHPLAWVFLTLPAIVSVADMRIRAKSVPASTVSSIAAR